MTQGKKKPKRRGKEKPKSRSKKPPTPGRRELKLEELKEILSRARTYVLSEEDLDKLDGAVDTLAFLTQELERKGTSVKRLRKLIFGAGTEKTSAVLGDSDSDQTKGDADDTPATAGEAGDGGAGEAGDGGEGKQDKGKTDDEKKNKRKGHGRNGAKDYKGAGKVNMPHETLKRGDPCPECPNGKLYPMKEPAVIVRVTGMAPLEATVYEMERLRCNLCGLVVTATPPRGSAGRSTTRPPRA